MDNRFQNKRVLLLEGYARQILPYLKAYKMLGCETTVLCGSKLDLAYVSKYADHKIVGVCDTERYDESESCVVRLIQSGGYDIVVPMGDFAATILSKNKELLEPYALIAVNDFPIFDQALDKLNVMTVCMEHGIACPKTLVGIHSAQQVVKARLTYPLVVKPRRDCGARGFHVFESQEDFLKLFAQTDLESYVVQEYIPQTEHNMSAGLFIDHQGNLKSSYVYASRRWYPIKGGTGTFNELIDRPDVVQMCYKLAKIMKLTGTVGFDLIEDPRDHLPKILEINPRVLACAKIAFEAGVNQALQLLEKEYQMPVTPFQPTCQKLYIRMTQIDLLWFLKSPDRLRAKPSWFRMRDVKDQTFSIEDPWPWFAFLFRGLGRLKKENKARE